MNVKIAEYLSGVALLIGSVVFVYLKGYSLGDAHRDNVWRAWYNSQMISAFNKNVETINKLSSAQNHHMDMMALITTSFQKELQNEKDTHDRDVAAARSHTIVLRDPGATAMRPCEGSGVQVAGASIGGDGSRGAELSDKVTEDLFSLADDADTVVRKLTACQEVVKDCRQAINDIQESAR